MNISREIRKIGDNCTFRYVEKDAAGNNVFSSSLENISIKPYGSYNGGKILKAVISKPRYNDMVNGIQNRESALLGTDNKGRVEIEKNGKVISIDYAWMTFNAEDVFIRQDYREVLLYLKNDAATVAKAASVVGEVAVAV